MAADGAPPNLKHKLCLSLNFPHLEVLYNSEQESISELILEFQIEHFGTFLTPKDSKLIIILGVWGSPPPLKMETTQNRAVLTLFQKSILICFAIEILT